MTVTYTQTAEEQKKDFLFAYYHYPILWFQRRFLGPFLAGTSLFLIFATYMGGLSPIWYVYDLLFLFLGGYHILRPRLAMRKMYFEENEKSEIELDDESFLFKGRQVDIRLKRGDILAWTRKKEFLLLKIRLNRTIYLFLNLDKIEEKEVFLEKVELFINRSEESDPAHKTVDPPEDSRNRPQST